MAETFEQVRRAVLQYVPQAPPFLAARVVQTGYAKLCDSRTWSWLRSETELVVRASRSGTVNVAEGSAVVQGVSLVFVAGDVDRQFRIGVLGLPVTILSVDLVLNRATLERPWRLPSQAAVSGTVLDAYATMPADFGMFLAVVDVSNAHLINHYVTDDELNYYDPQRSRTGDPRALATRRLSSVTSTLGRVQYEWSPYPASQRAFPAYYRRRPEELTEDVTLPGVLRDRPDVLVSFALSELYAMPAIGDRRNPHFNLELAKQRRGEALYEAANLEARDEEVFLTWLQTVGIDQLPMYTYPFASHAMVDDIRRYDL